MKLTLDFENRTVIVHDTINTKELIAYIRQLKEWETWDITFETKVEIVEVPKYYPYSSPLDRPWWEINPKYTHEYKF